MALSGSLVSLGTLVGIYALLALGLNLKFGYTGLLEIGHVAFYLVGAYVTVLLVLPPASTREFSTYVLGWGWPWIPALAVGTIAAAVFGMLVALPAIRLREDYLAIALLGISVIVQRFVRAEAWFANGPESLRGYSLPLRDLFAAPDGTLASAVVFGAVVAVLWAVAVYALARLRLDEILGPRTRRLASGLFGVATLGVGWVLARRVRTADRPVGTIAALGGAGVGAVASVVGLAAPAVAAVAFLGPYSVFTWILGAVLARRHYRALGSRETGVALGLAVAFVVVFLPLVFASSGGENARTVGLLLTIALLAGFLYGVYALYGRWGSTGSTAAFLQVIGLGAVWLFAIRYFVQPGAAALLRGDLGTAVSSTLVNLLWLLEFDTGGIALDYARFLLLLTLASVGLVYLLLEVTVSSPFGRVLKAVREDQDVAAALAKNTFVFKVQSMMLGSAVAGFAGGLTAMYFGTIVNDMFAPRVTFIVVLIVIIGGLSNNRGAVLGAVIYWLFQKGTSDIAGFFPPERRATVQALRFVVIGVFLVVVLYYRPEGLWGEETKT